MTHYVLQATTISLMIPYNQIPFHLQIYGKWIYVIGVSDQSKSQYSPEVTLSSWIDVSPTADSTDLTLRWGERMYEPVCLSICHYFSLSLSVSVSISLFQSLSPFKEFPLAETCSSTVF